MIESFANTKITKLLVVDDDVNEMNSLAIGLRLEGFDAEGASTGVEALARLEKSEYAAVLIDLMMPEMNGLQLARRIRVDFPRTLTIMMSAYHLSPVQLAKADTGVVGFVPKPYRFDELVHFIKQKLSPSPSASLSPARESDDTGLAIPIDIPPIIGEVEREQPKPVS